LKGLAEKSRVETVQEECFTSLLNYNKLHYPNTSRFGRLVVLYAEVLKLKFIGIGLDDKFFKNKLGVDGVANFLKEMNKV
jgi:hypothetical protein